MEVRFVDGVRDVPEEAWDALVGADDPPFLEWRFLEACEAASAVPAEGSQACHATVWDGARLVAALPLYVKADGRGEFIYDYAWWRFAARAGIDYYPKLVSMTPFTPVPGRHLLTAPGVDRERLLPALIEAVEEWSRRAGVRGVHYLFLTEEEAAGIERLGYLRRLTAQLVWRNEGYADLDAFLARFRSKDRVKIKRELRRFEEQGLALEVVRGEGIGPEHLEAIHGFYQRTCAAYGTGSDYLKRGTWERLLGGPWRRRVVLFFARRGAERVAGSFCAQKGETLYGRYWGTRQELPSLYFNMAFYRPIELAIREGWARFFAGAGITHAKFSRGFEAWEIRSVHKVFSDELLAVLTRHLAEDRELMRAELAALRQASRLRPGPPPR